MTLYDQTKMIELEHTNTAQRSIISENSVRQWFSTWERKPQT